jgi:hypothetical protein
MIRGHFFAATGTWNCTYICPTVICAFGPGVATELANFVIFGTPPTKKLPWSQICRFFVRNFASALEPTRVNKTTADKL